MVEHLSASAIKTMNQQRIAQYCYTHESVTKHDLERDLGLSLPTITQNLHDLESSGIIFRQSLQESTGGRRAQQYAFDAESHIAVGASLHSRGVTMCAIDLHGGTVARRTIRLERSPLDEGYYAEADRAITSFARSMESRSDSSERASKVLGVAFAIQGLVSGDGESITFGSIMGDTGRSLEDIAGEIPLPCMMIHDSDASAMAELWFDQSIEDAVCLYLERRIGGGIILNGRLYQGHSPSSGLIEHMTLVPDGRPCYCGQRGCVDPYCSTENLIHGDESLEQAFAAIRNERGNAVKRRNDLERWLDHVAAALKNMRMMFASDVILGGEASRYLDDAMLKELRRRVLAKSPFVDEFNLRRSLCLRDQSIVGAALRLISPYVDLICGTQSGESPAWQTQVTRSLGLPIVT
ncbi:ROK family protein [Bifidobacterium sp.]|uniref:ROK family protein n=1 Tax=Bifidobacterium sp. TaxID=41200 RepID=UPI0039E947C6